VPSREYEWLLAVRFDSDVNVVYDAWQITAADAEVQARGSDVLLFTDEFRNSGVPEPLELRRQV
jgi:hypothetical protein